MPKQLLATAAIAYLLAAAALIILSVRRGRGVSELLALRDPELFERLGRPRPTYFDSPGRTRFDQFILQRGYRELADPQLTDQCEALRRFNLRVLAILLSGLGVLGVAILYWKQAA